METKKLKLSDIAGIIEKNENFIILTHFSADGDAIGSSLALSLILQKLDKEVCIIFEEEMSAMYSFLPAASAYCLKTLPQKPVFGEYTVISLDTGDISRLGERQKIFQKAALSINIDHHHTNQGYADHNFIDSTYSSTGEIVYELMLELGTELDRDISMCIYVAIVTDTGGFKHGNTNSRTHLIVSELLKFEVDTSYIAMQVFDKITKAKLLLMRRALDSLVFFLDSRVIVMKITKDDFDDTKTQDDDTEGLVELARNIENVEIAVFIRESKQDSFRVNLRSNTEFDVSEIAALMNGGGHKKAAGCNFKGDYEKNLAILIEEISKRI